MIEHLSAVVFAMEVVDRGRSVLGTNDSRASVLVADVRKCLYGGQRCRAAGAEMKGANAKQRGVVAKWKEMRPGRGIGWAGGVRVLRVSCPDSRKAPLILSPICERKCVRTAAQTDTVAC